ncbi:MAG: IMP dehydrogenase [Deltaproteobacteria bacterium RIFCSPHIGHO2_02_FULL_40_11]|nr:MAG: IMP dehydrogenase [Deltaproteobacteria bacterium RIFCSPHIGHO2_02_FULL_40_11]
MRVIQDPKEQRFSLGLTFDDLLLVPQHSEILPQDVSLKTRLAGDLTLNIPLISAAMDTVTESKTAISMARLGGIGVIHKNLSPKLQAFEVEKVKKSESGMILDPITISPDEKISKALDLMQQYHISGVPVTQGTKLVGILTNRDLRFEKNLEQKVQDVMTSQNLITAPEGTTLLQAKEILHQNRIEKLPVVDAAFNLKGLITIKDIEKSIHYPHSQKDRFGRLMVAAAVGVSQDREERIHLLLQNHCDVLCIDTAHGNSKNVIEAVRDTKRNFKNALIIAGNVSSGEGAEKLIQAGADAIKVGQGPGSICTTRIVTGCGMPQMTAIMECIQITRKKGIPLIADGGIKYSGDITKALAAGADSVMIGNLFAGTDESPGESVLYQGRSYKVYRGMGSLGAMQMGSTDRYQQSSSTPLEKLVPEGIEGMVPYKGKLSQSVYQLLGGIRSGMGYVGARTISELHEKAKFVRVSPSGHKESHVHDVLVTKEAPNYRIET